MKKFLGGIVSRRDLLAGAATVAALASLGATRVAAQGFSAPTPGATDAPKVILRFATAYVGTHPMRPSVDAIIARFREDYPNVTVTIEETPGNDHQTKIKLDASSNRMPDLFSYWRLDPGFGLDQIARAGLVADLTEWMESDPFFDGLFDASSIRTASLDGRVYGVPSIMFYIQILANREVFERAGVQLPTDWESLNAAVAALKAGGVTPWAVSIGKDGQAGRLYNYVVNRTFGNAQALQMHSGQAPIGTPEMVEAMRNLQTLVVGNVPEDAITLKNDDVYPKYVNPGVTAMVIDGSWATGRIDKAVQDKMTVLNFPLIPGGAQTETNVERDLTTLWYMGAKGYADDEKRPYLLELVRRLSSREVAKTFAEQASQPVPQLGVEIDQAKVGRLPAEAQALALASPANKWIPSVMVPDQRAKFEAQLSEFFAGRYTPEEFTDGLAGIFGS